MHYIVTGGAGFIGSHLTDELLTRGHTVTVIDSLASGKKENINEKATFLNIDLSKTTAKELQDIFEASSSKKPADTETAEKNHLVAGIFHLAAHAQTQTPLPNLAQTHEINMNATVKILTAARESGIGRIVFASSAAVYGEPTHIPTTEEEPTRPMNAYGVQKLADEHYCRVFSLQYGLPTVCLRFFNVYGPRMPYSGPYAGVVRIFLEARRTLKPIPICGDGTQTRDFIHVSDLVRALIAAMESATVGAGETINVGAGREVSVNALASLFGTDQTHTRPRPEPHSSCADITKAKTLLNWEPTISLEDGIKNLLT